MRYKGLDEATEREPCEDMAAWVGRVVPPGYSPMSLGAVRRLTIADTRRSDDHEADRHDDAVR
jgi:hypothetical protein